MGVWDKIKQGAKAIGKTVAFGKKALGGNTGAIYANAIRAIPEFHDFYGGTKKLLEQNGQKTITSIVSCRTPLSAPTQSLVKILHNGKIPVDNLFHLYLRIHLNDGTQLIFEKHGSPTMSVAGSPRPDEERRMIRVNSGLKLEDFVRNGINKAGKRNFFVYDPFNSNCQDFQLALLSGSSQVHLTGEDRAWIDQDAKKIAENVPSWAKSTSADVIQLFSKLRVL